MSKLCIWNTHTIIFQGKITGLAAKAANLVGDSDPLACVHTWLKFGKNVKKDAFSKWSQALAWQERF